MTRQASRFKQINLDFAFFQYLIDFYRSNKGFIRSNYRVPTRKILDYNDPEKNPSAFLRRPQFEALEMYVFIKEYLKNPLVYNIFEDWRRKRGKFERRADLGLSTDKNIPLFDTINEDKYDEVFTVMQRFSHDYANYIFALTMGIGKTILMGTCIFYEFILANIYPKDELYCQNALVFAPDKTVLESLKEITYFDLSKVVPPEYQNWILRHIQFHFLDEAGTTLNTLDGSMFNIIITNTQKVILKKQHKVKTLGDKLFETQKPILKATSKELADIKSPENEMDLLLNQRFSKLCRLPRIGIYVDEAHHSFGAQLAKDMGIKSSKTSLRTTIDELAFGLQIMGSKVVSCYNFTGTPYIGNQVLPEVVYAYGLNEAINNKYLKKVILHSFTNPHTDTFVRAVISDFWKMYGENRKEGMLPKLVIFAASIGELITELRPAVEEILNTLGISLDKVLINVGDPKITTNDDLREFNRLDTTKSEKQFILLVNKGKEGWNCRSLFGVAMYRSPDSKVFVLQATMRCLRAIGESQETASVYLSEENEKILDEELQQNFHLSIKKLQESGSNHQPYNIRIIPPNVELKFIRIRTIYEFALNGQMQNADLMLDQLDMSKYQIIHTQREGFKVDNNNWNHSEDISHLKKKRIFSPLTLTAEIARYLNRSCLEINEVIYKSKQGMDAILKVVNDHNEVLYDWIIPHLFNTFYTVEKKAVTEEDTIKLVNQPINGHFTVNADPQLVVNPGSLIVDKHAHKSFHLDTYCFDSHAELVAFRDIIAHQNVQKVYFTGMLTHGQTEFHIHYVDPELLTVRTYYPDFLIECINGSWIIVEVKRDDLIEDPVVKAKKEYAERHASANKMKYEIIKSSEARRATNYLQLH